MSKRLPKAERLNCLNCESARAPKKGSMDVALKRIRAAGGKAWDKIADPEAFIRDVRGDGTSRPGRTRKGRRERSAPAAPLRADKRDLPLLVERIGRQKGKKWRHRTIELSFGPDTHYNLKIGLPSGVDDHRANGRPIPGCVMTWGGLDNDHGYSVVTLFRSLNAEECRWVAKAFVAAARGLAECERRATKDERFDPLKASELPR